MIHKILIDKLEGRFLNIRFYLDDRVREKRLAIETIPYQDSIFLYTSPRLDEVIFTDMERDYPIIRRLISKHIKERDIRKLELKIIKILYENNMDTKVLRGLGLTVIDRRIRR
ncbi:MAG: hypothetical protein DRP27_06350 [Thermotogae bacterium]|nr:MAG: hypothetical protein DRP27_06350 [Thermotogota bacterium]